MLNLCVYFFQGSNPSLQVTQEELLKLEVVQVVKDRLSDDMRNILEAEFTENEVFLAAKNLKPHVVPGPDGMLALFYQQFWSIVGKGVTSFALKILNGGENPSNINYTYICLIPKKKKLKVPGDFQPISLCNVIFKIITKTIANRLKLILPDIIEKFQSAFVPGRLITDNALLPSESFHYMRKKSKGKKGCVALKLHMSKAYDRIEWNFLIEVLQSMGFFFFLEMAELDFQLYFHCFFLCFVGWKSLSEV